MNLLSMKVFFNFSKYFQIWLGKSPLLPQTPAEPPHRVRPHLQGVQPHPPMLLPHPLKGIPDPLEAQVDHPIRGKVSQLPTHPNRLLDMEVDPQGVPQDTPVRGLAIMGVPHNLQGGTDLPILAMEVTQVVVISNHPKETMGILVHPTKDPRDPQEIRVDPAVPMAQWVLVDPVLLVLFQCLLTKVDLHLHHWDNLKKLRLQVHLQVGYLQVLRLNHRDPLQNLQVLQNLLPHLQHRQMW